MRDAYEQTQTVKGSDNRGAGQTVPPVPNLKRVLLEDEPAKKRRRTGHVSHQTSADDGHELLQSDTDEPHPLKSANKNKKSKPNTHASGGAGAKELRRSSRVQAKQDDDGYAGSETPAEKRRRVRGKKEAPDKYIPCKICNKWDCDNMSNQMLICDGCIVLICIANAYQHDTCPKVHGSGYVTPALRRVCSWRSCAKTSAGIELS